MFRRFRPWLPRLLLVASVTAASLAPQAASANVVVVLNSRDATVQLLDQASQKSLQTFPVGKEPHHLMATPDNKSLIVASSMGNELVFLDPKSGQVQRRIKDILDPYQIGFTPDQKYFVATALRLDHVDLYRYNGRDFTLAKRIPLPKLPSHVAFDARSTMAFVTQQGMVLLASNARSTMAFVTQQGSDQVSAIDLASGTVRWTLPVGKLPAGIAMTPDDRYLLVGIMGSDYVEVIDWRARKTVKRIKAGAGAHNFRAHGDGRYTYVSNRVANSINIIDQKTLQNVGQINVPGGPDCMEVTADGKTMWVTLRWIRKVAVIDLTTRKLVKMIPVGRSPHGVFFANSSARL